MGLHPWRFLRPRFFPQMSFFHVLFRFLGPQEAQCQELNVAVSALVWLSPSVLVSGAEDGSLHGWMLRRNSLQSLWLSSVCQKPVLGLAASQEFLASASGTPGQCYRIISLKYAGVSLRFITNCARLSKSMHIQCLFTAFESVLSESRFFTQLGLLKSLASALSLWGFNVG